jgi:hypothetical protein
MISKGFCFVAFFEGVKASGRLQCKSREIPIDGILGTNGEITINSNGHKLKDFASVKD